MGDVIVVPWAYKLTNVYIITKINTLLVHNSSVQCQLRLLYLGALPSVEGSSHAHTHTHTHTSANLTLGLGVATSCLLHTLCTLCH